MFRRRFLALSAGVLAAPARAADPARKIRTLYEKGGGFSDDARSLEGSRLTLQGFMAPPLKADARFFVLTSRPLAVCPFCETAAEWPDDIIAIYTKRVIDVVPFNVRIEARGVLDLTGFKDPETGFYSKMRLVDATYDE